LAVAVAVFTTAKAMAEVLEAVARVAMAQAAQVLLVRVVLEALAHTVT
jgi:hypothetical protein